MSHWENNGKSDEWYTPKYVFDALGCEFDIDVAAPIDRSFCHVPAQAFITKDSLKAEWLGFVWMNAPFGGRNAKAAWLNKIHTHGNGVALTPDRTSAPWYQEALKKADGILLVNHKIKFIKPNGSTGDQPGNGTTLFAYGRQGLKALIRAQISGLGTFCTSIDKVLPNDLFTL